jgi:hypothetical protein
MILEFTKHPILQPPSDEEIVALGEMDYKLLQKLHDAHEGRIKAAEEDPLRYGFELAGWSRMRQSLENYDEVITFGGNRSGKTTGCAKMVMEAVTQNQDGHVVCFSQNADTSVKVQQAAIWEMMPKEFKRKTKSIEGYINFSMQNGFTGSSFIFPDTRTRVDFKTYTQFSNNQTILEGFEFGFKGSEGLNIGAWLDEYLGDAALVNTLRFRLATRNSKMLLGFTPIDGYTPFVSEYLKGAETLETRNAELLGREVPVKQYSPERDAGIVYLHSDENPFGGYNRIAKDLKNSSEDQIMVRAYGLPTKSMTSLLPNFSPEVNVLSDKPNKYGQVFPDYNGKINVEGKESLTWYQVVDPAFARNYVSIWAGVSESDEIFIRREWPDRGTYGEWALFGDPKWRYGPASKKIGYDVEMYCELFKEIEDELGIEVMERIGDSRFFAKENENNVDLFTKFYDYGLNFIASDGQTEQIGATALDEWFFYNPNYDIDEANRPRCYIHEDCGNLIESVINYNSQGKADEALKDFFDVLRYLRMSNGGYGPDYFASNEMYTTMRNEGGY